MENSENKYSHIKGWNVDADPRNEPTYPMKKYTGDDHNRLDYQKAPQQEINIEVLHSNERPNVTAVFGTAVPPSGLSGRIRRYAFKHSESSYLHWLPLFLADRVNVVEGLLSDFMHGSIPNVFAERGWKANWKHNRGGAMKQAISGAVIASIAIIFLLKRGKRFQST
ncbi:MAG TPA: hypothetical protein VGC65_10235 [Bacteroidia bacterium]